MEIKHIKIGQRVKTLRPWSGVPNGTEGIIIQDYGTGIWVAWDLPDRPYPWWMTPQEVALMYAVHPQCPHRDGFNKERELHYLDVVG